MVVALFLSLILVVFRVFVRAFLWELVLGVGTPSAYGSLIGCVFLHPLRSFHRLVLRHLLQLPHPLPLLLSGIVVLVISLVLDCPVLLVVVY
jgi:hypothetical protein